MPTSFLWTGEDIGGFSRLFWLREKIDLLYNGSYRQRRLDNGRRIIFLGEGYDGQNRTVGRGTAFLGRA